jgi:ATP-binding cassette subfamily B protein
LPDDSRLPIVPAPVHGTVPAAPDDLPRTPFAFIWHYMRGFRGHVVLMMVLIAASSGVDTLQSYVLGQLVNALARVNAADPVTWFAALCGTWFAGYLFTHSYASFTSYTQIMTRARIHDEMFGYLLGHAPRYFLDQASGALASKIRVAAGSAVIVIDYVGPNIAKFGVLFAVTGVVIARNAPQLLGLAGVFLVGFSVLSAILAQSMRAYAKANSAAASAQSARVVDTVANWDVVRSFAATAEERAASSPSRTRKQGPSSACACPRRACGWFCTPSASPSWHGWRGMRSARRGPARSASAPSPCS